MSLSPVAVLRRPTPARRCEQLRLRFILCNTCSKMSTQRSMSCRLVARTATKLSTQGAQSLRQSSANSSAGHTSRLSFLAAIRAEKKTLTMAT